MVLVGSSVVLELVLAVHNYNVFAYLDLNNVLETLNTTFSRCRSFLLNVYYFLRIFCIKSSPFFIRRL